jgi:hypothetical protein
MHTTIAKQARVQDATRTAKALHAPPPANLDAIDKKHRLRAELYNAALAVAHASRDRAPTHLGPEAVAVWLLPKTDWFAWDEDTAGALAELIDAHRQATAAIDLPRERLDIGECGSMIERDGPCRERLLPFRGQHTIVCPACGRVWDVQDRRETAFAQARAVLQSAADTARALTAAGYRTTPNAVYLWVHKGRLEAALCDVPSRTPLYRFSDAYEIAREIREKRAKRTRDTPSSRIAT